MSAPDPAFRSVQTVAEMHARAEQMVGRQQRTVEAVTGALARPVFFYCLLGLVGLWISVNMLWQALAHRRPFDPPPFSWLQGLLGLLALLVTTAVLITQSRQGKMAERRAMLDLQVNLLVEQKVAKMIALIEELRRDLPSVHNRPDEQAEAMTRPIDPHAMIADLEEQVQQTLEEQHQAQSEENEEDPQDAPAKAGPPNG